MCDVSILIVHYNTPGLLRQTLKGIIRAAPQVSYEIIVVDNNPEARIIQMVNQEFPQVKVIVSEVNEGFAKGINHAMKEASGRYFFSFNPDMVMLPKALEELVSYLDQHQTVGAVGPRLQCPSGELQQSCYRFMEVKTIFYRRLPFLKKLSFAKTHLQNYLMEEWDHQETREVDYLLGAAILLRREMIEKIGAFDERFFMYFEDQDLCRRCWDAGWKVVYHPFSVMIHYHRRETAEGNFFQQLLRPLTRHQIKSALYYYQKYHAK